MCTQMHKFFTQHNIIVDVDASNEMKIQQNKPNYGACTHVHAVYIVYMYTCTCKYIHKCTLNSSLALLVWLVILTGISSSVLVEYCPNKFSKLSSSALHLFCNAVYKIYTFLTKA